jgi:asparagine synthase (glutamine-hydrolysing)
MCGIFGIFSSRPLPLDLVNEARAATLALTHRGPDAQGEFIDIEKGIFLGHRRLKIIDLSPLANQPMEKNGLVLSFNGEIYNFQSIKSRLEGLGHSFTTLSDTEVFVDAWKKWGRKSLDELDGMFALSLWDGTFGWLAVDPFSEKQIYYAHTDYGLVFSSELELLAEFVNAKATLASSMPDFITLGYIPSPKTIFPSIKKLDPATWLQIRAGKIINSGKYWNPDGPARQSNDLPNFDNKALDKVSDLIINSIESRLISDVPACLFLSSGIDSALIAAIIKKELNRDIEALTIAFPAGDIHDESVGAQKISTYLGVPHQVLLPNDSDSQISPSGLLKLFGQPNANITVASGFQMSRAAYERGFRVGLMGIGADELFFGYEKQNFAFRNRRLYNTHHYVRKGLGLASSMLSKTTAGARIYSQFIALDDGERLPALKVPEMIDELRKIPGFKDWQENYFGQSKLPFEFEVANSELNSTMVNSQLQATDLCSMQASFEMRTPFLNREIYDFMSQWNWKDLMNRGRKWVLKTLLEKYIPTNMLLHEKRGFIAPADLFIEQFTNPPLDFPYLPESLLTKAWANRHQPKWRTIALRILLMNEFYISMSEKQRL